MRSVQCRCLGAEVEAEGDISQNLFVGSALRDLAHFVHGVDDLCGFVCHRFWEQIVRGWRLVGRIVSESENVDPLCFDAAQHDPFYGGLVLLRRALYLAVSSSEISIL